MCCCTAVARLIVIHDLYASRYSWLCQLLIASITIGSSRPYCVLCFIGAWVSLLMQSSLFTFSLKAEPHSSSLNGHPSGMQGCGTLPSPGLSTSLLPCHLTSSKPCTNSCDLLYVRASTTGPGLPVQSVCSAGRVGGGATGSHFGTRSLRSLHRQCQQLFQQCKSNLPLTGQEHFLCTLGSGTGRQAQRRCVSAAGQRVQCHKTQCALWLAGAWVLHLGPQAATCLGLLLSKPMTRFREGATAAAPKVGLQRAPGDLRPVVAPEHRGQHRRDAAGQPQPGTLSQSQARPCGATQREGKEGGGGLGWWPVCCAGAVLPRSHAVPCPLTLWSSGTRT